MAEDLEFEAWFEKAIRKVQEGQRPSEEEPQDQQTDEVQED